jgi:hypothetical protein
MTPDYLALLRHRITSAHSYDVFEHELDQLEHGATETSASASLASVFFTMFFSIVISLSTSEPHSFALYAAFIGVLFASGVLFVVFLVVAIRSKTKVRQVVERIRQRAVGPLGDETKPIRTADLEDLTPEEPTSQTGAK